MKILIINQEHALFGGPGGAERSVQSIAEYFAVQGHRVTSVTVPRQSFVRDTRGTGIHSIRNINGVNTVLLTMRDRKVSYAELILTLVLEEQPDVIHTNVFHTVTTLWRLLAPLNIPIIHTIREYKLLCKRNMFSEGRDCGKILCLECDRASNDAREASRLVHGVVGISRFTLHRHLDAGFFSASAAKEVIHNSYQAQGEVTRRISFVGGQRPRLGFFGRLHESKGVDLLLDTLADLPLGTMSLRLAGDVQNPTILERISEVSKLQDVSYVGFTEPEQFFREIDVLVVPSIWHEPFGRVAIEALAHGVPVIASKRGGLSDIIIEGKNGWLFDPEDRHSLFSRFQRITDMPFQSWKALSEAAEQSSHSYGHANIGDQYLAVYRKVIEHARLNRTKTEEALMRFYHLDAKRRKVPGALISRRSNRQARPVKVLVVVGEFPKLSETFVLNHITGLIDLGLDVEVAFSYRGAEEKAGPDYWTYDLRDRSFCIRPTFEEQKISQHRLSMSAQAYRELDRISHGSSDSMISAPTTVAEFLAGQADQVKDEHGARLLARRCQDVDVIHCHFGHRPAQVFRMLDRAGMNIPVVCSFHGIDMSAHIEQYGKELYNGITRRLRKALPVSEFFADRLLSLGFAKGDVRVHRVGVDLGKFTYAPRVRLPGQPLRLVSVGRMVEKKGFEFGLKALSVVRSLAPNLQFSYTLIGEGILQESLRELVSELDLTESVRLSGALSHNEVAKVMGECHALIVPSFTGSDGDMEGIPTVAMEASASGLPIIGTRHSGLPEIVLQGITGLLSDERDPVGMAKNIMLLYGNPEIGGTFGRAGRVHVQHEFNIRRQNEKLAQLYTEIAESEDI